MIAEAAEEISGHGSYDGAGRHVIGRRSNWRGVVR